ncbi:MAG: Gfo/Idh/MocA family oxidoreductase [Planctomycetes bacterium]|nr:Gfo/Idh/MocA family oxidoreductase [Planctomycetota bacterium]MCB9887787.1 Gfo/Idh/MocA family oxidoreductase [Planctomycetota bacterium]
MTTKPTKLSRRTFLQSSAGAMAVPLIAPSHLFGQRAPSNVLRIGAIGTGRMGTGDMQAVAKQGLIEGVDAHVVAVCDLDQTRAFAAKNWLDKLYKDKLPGAAPDVGVYRDFRELLARDDIDAVTISTPEHWHALCAIAAAKAKKGIYVQKPMTYSHREGQLLVKAVRESGVILQVGSQQRSDAKFRQACELVRNGRLGKLHRIHVYLPPDHGTGDPKQSPVPAGFDFDTWLGPTEKVPYAMEGVHPQSAADGKPNFSRPGWLQIRRYCLGMITGWGSHMNDIAQWGHGGDTDSGPVEIQATAEFPQRGLFDVHTQFKATGKYADGVELIQETGNPAGVRFTGERGTIFVQRGKIEADPAEILKEKIGDGETKLYVSGNHYRNWLECVRSKQEPICPVEVGHRSNTICVITDIAMRTGRKLQWDPKAEKFVGDDAANALLDYEHRAPWTL